jgi:hypothetical protein
MFNLDRPIASRLTCLAGMAGLALLFACGSDGGASRVDAAARVDATADDTADLAS